MDKNAYFASRAAVGQTLGDELIALKGKKTAILALSPGAVVIAMEMARKLHSIAALLLLKNVYLPGEPSAVGVVNDKGSFTHDSSISAGQMEEW